MEQQEKNLGFSLIEAIVALGVFSLLVASISGTAGLTYLSEIQGGERTVAQAYAVEGMEAIRSIRELGWSELTIGQHGLSKEQGYWELSGSEDVLGQFTRTINIAEVYRDVDGTILAEGGSLDLHTKLVSVLIAWEISPGNDNEFLLENYLTNWASLDWQQTNWSGGDGQASWSVDNQYWTADESVNISTVGELSLNQAGTNPSPYALLMHLDGPRYQGQDLIDNYSFENYLGTAPNVDFNDWTEYQLGSDFSVEPGYQGSSAVRIDYQWPLALGGVYQAAIPVDGDTTYQLSFFVKGNVSYNDLIVRDEDNYYLRSNGSFTWWFTDIAIDVFYTENDWAQYTISFTTRSNASYLYITLNGWAMNFGQWLAIDNVVLSQEIVYDEGSYQNHGFKRPSDDNGPDYVGGNFDQALDFDGAAGSTSGDYVLISASDSLNITGPITLEAWVNPDNLGGGIERPVITKWSDSGGDWRSYSLSVLSNGKLRFSLSKDGQSGNGHTYSLDSSSQIQTGQWQHVVGVYDNTKMRVYINGEPRGTKDYDQGIFDSSVNADVLIGSTYNNSYNDNRFNGKIDEVSIELIALTDTQVEDHYNNSPLTPEDVIVWFAPTPIGVFMADKKVAGMHINGDYLYIALLDKKRVEIFDLSSNPENPASLGIFTTTNKSEDVFTYGKYFYVMTDISSPGIEIYHYESSPIEATPVGTINLNDQPSGVWIDGDVLYVSLNDHSVQVFDLGGDPAVPVSLGDFATTNTATDISIYGDYAYVSLDDDTEALQTFDISLDPANPTSTNIASAIEEVNGVTSMEDYLFLITKGTSRKVLVYNIGDEPSIPVALGDLDIYDNGWDIAVRGSYIYVGLGGSTKGVQVFDMTFMLAGGSGDTNFEVYGTLESSAFDTGNASGFNFLSWSETLPAPEDNIKVQIKTAPTVGELAAAPWVGLSGINTYYEAGNETIIYPSNGHNGDRWLKYLVSLYGSGDTSPILHDLKINYTP
ncbi:MAG: LamG-like jellyroll fold domain-containing protein [Candidatus Komeilibacteria bacterium]